jgi:hypothetical protein
VAGEVKPNACSDHEECKKDCSKGTPVCVKYGKNPDTDAVECESYETPETCTCKPKCELDSKYPLCCSGSVEDKKGYRCLKTCTLPNGDTVDFKEDLFSKSPRCSNFSDCCYGLKNSGTESADPVETEVGDPRDQCKLKCQDVCNDKLFVGRKVAPNRDFPQCCTSLTPLKIACFCCRTTANYNSAQCEYFRRFFTCKEAGALNCAAEPAKSAPICQPNSTVVVNATEYDPNYDPYLEFDPRFAYCGSTTSNLACQYICRGHGVITQANAPQDGIWKERAGDITSEKYESNLIKYIQGNCKTDLTDGESEKNQVTRSLNYF